MMVFASCLDGLLEYEVDAESVGCGREVSMEVRDGRYGRQTEGGMQLSYIGRTFGARVGRD